MTINILPESKCGLTTYKSTFRDELESQELEQMVRDNPEKVLDVLCASKGA